MASIEWCQRDGCGGHILNGLCNRCGVHEEQVQDVVVQPTEVGFVVKVSGILVRILEVTLGSGQLGQCDIKKSEILIDKHLSQELKEDTILHEVIHMISDANALGLQETDVAVLAVNLSQYLRDN